MEAALLLVGIAYVAVLIYWPSKWDIPDDCNDYDGQQWTTVQAPPPKDHPSCSADKPPDKP